MIFQVMKRLAIIWCAVASLETAFAQRGTGDWMTTAFDAQRSNWVRTDGKISKESMAKPGFELVWKMKFTNTPRGLNTITPPALLDFYIGYRGFRTLGFFGASADRVIGVDTDIARLEWEKSYPAAGGAATLPCPGGLTSAVTRPTMTMYPPVPTGAGIGRGTPARSGVGEPMEGAVTLRRAPSPAPPAPPKPAATKPAAPAAAAFSPFAPRVQWVLAVTGDGKLRQYWVSNGNEPETAAPFVPAGANAMGLVSYDGVTYVATSGGCGGAADGVWAMEMATKKVASWKAPKGIAGTAGMAVGPEGTLYAASGGTLTALEAKTLAVKGTYQAGGVEFTSTPVVFEFKGKDLIAAVANDGRVHVVDGADLSKAAARSEAVLAAGYETGALASWQDPSGTRWVLAPSEKAVQAFKVVEKDGGIAIEAAWKSRELMSPLAPVVVNGVVFALSSGEFRTKDPAMTAAQRAAKSTAAVLYALDAATGQELWSSGKTMTSFVHSGSLAAGGSRVYVATYDGTQYAFGFPIEH